MVLLVWIAQGTLNSNGCKQKRMTYPRHVGASLLAKVVNDNARILDARGALEFFASKLAPTVGEAYETRLALTSFACSSAWYDERTNGPDATFLKPIL